MGQWDNCPLSAFRRECIPERGRRRQTVRRQTSDFPRPVFTDTSIVPPLAGGRWCRKAPKGGRQRRHYKFIARRAIHNPQRPKAAVKPENPPANGRSNLRTFYTTFYTTFLHNLRRSRAPFCVWGYSGILLTPCPPLLNYCHILYNKVSACYIKEAASGCFLLKKEGNHVSY